LGKLGKGKRKKKGTKKGSQDGSKAYNAPTLASVREKRRIRRLKERKND